MTDRIRMTQLDDQIAQLDRERQKMRLDLQQKESQMNKYGDLIEQSESALNKMMLNS